MDFLKKVITSVGSTGLAPNFPYVLDGQIASEAEFKTTGGIWSIHDAHNTNFKKGDPLGSATVFIADLTKSSLIACAARNSLKRLKVLRHPQILKLFDGVEADGKIYIATEPVKPFTQLQSKVTNSREHLLWNIHSLVNALKFTNEDAKIVHGNVRRSSVFLTEAGELKLAGFELATGIFEQQSLLPKAMNIFRDANWNAWPPELQNSSWDDLRGQPIHSIDSWMLASLINELMDVCPPNLVSFCRDSSSDNPGRRHSASTLLEPTISQRCFNVDLIAADRLVGMLAGVDPAERDRVFINLLRLIPKVPSDFIAFKLVPLSISALDIQQYSVEGIKLVLFSAGYVEQQVFSKHLEAFIVGLFGKPDRAIRLLLLDHFESFVDKLSDKLIQDIVFAHFASGFADTMPELRERTLKTSILLISKLTTRQINNDLVRNYARLQSDVQPGIRVNAIICFGKISSRLEQSSKPKILIGAISKALQDPFPPSRCTGLIALVATMDSMSNESLAKHLMPLACPLLVDPEKAVLEQAFTAVRRILEKLEKADSTQPSADPAKQKEAGSDNSGQWGAWGFGTLTSQVNKLQQKYAMPSRTSLATKVGTRVEKTNDHAIQKKVENDQAVQKRVDNEHFSQNGTRQTEIISGNSPSPQAPVEEPGAFASIDFNNGWGDEDELDPWAA